MVAPSTPYQDVNALLSLMLGSLRAILKNQFVGFYLGGSLALGDFDPRRSDIDFIVVTDEELSYETVAALEAMHRRLWTSGRKWATKLDGSYVPQLVVRHWTSEDAPCPFVEGNRFTVTNQGSAVIQRHIIRPYGVIVSGPSPLSLINRVDADNLRSALWNLLENWWRPLLIDPAWVRESPNQPFAVLTMCRALYTLDHGIVTSKPVAARWVQETIGDRWLKLINWALTWPNNTQSDQVASTLGLIDYTLQRYENHHAPG